MSIIHDYSKNGEILTTRDEILTETNFDRYIDQQTPAKAEGYMDATKDLVAQIAKIVFPAPDCYNSQATTTRLIREFLQDRQAFLESCKSKVDSPSP